MKLNRLYSSCLWISSLVFLFFGSTAELRAVDENFQTTDYINRHFDLCYGLSYHLVGAIATNPNSGYKTGVDFTSEQAFQLFIPFNKKATTGLALEYGNSALAFTTQNTSLADSTFPKHPESYTFTSFFPHFYINGLVIGAMIGLSPTGSVKTDGFTNVPKLKTFIIPRLGASVPLLDGEWGRVNFNIIGGYCFAGMYEDGKKYVNVHVTPTDDVSPTPVSLSIGLSFMFRAPIFY